MLETFVFASCGVGGFLNWLWLSLTAGNKEKFRKKKKRKNRSAWFFLLAAQLKTTTV